MADQLQYIDQQLLHCELSPGEQAAVDEFIVWSLQFRQQRHSELGHFPSDLVERSAWNARKQQLDESIESDVESECLLRGQGSNYALQVLAVFSRRLSASFESEQHITPQVSLRLGRSINNESECGICVEPC